MACCTGFEEDNLNLCKFGQNPVEFPARCTTTVEIDGVRGDGMKLHNVPDSAEHFLVTVGHTWTELPNSANVNV